MDDVLITKGETIKVDPPKPVNRLTVNVLNNGVIAANTGSSLFYVETTNYNY